MSARNLGVLASLAAGVMAVGILVWCSIKRERADPAWVAVVWCCTIWLKLDGIQRAIEKGGK